MQENFESYPTRNWQPMESFKKWVGIITLLLTAKLTRGCAVLEPLESGKIFRWEDRKHGIAVVESRFDKCSCNIVTSILSDVSANSPEISDTKIDGLRAKCTQLWPLNCLKSHVIILIMITAGFIIFLWLLYTIKTEMIHFALFK